MKIYFFIKYSDFSTEFFTNKSAAQLALIKEATTGSHQLPPNELKNCLASLFENENEAMYIPNIGWIGEDEVIE